MIPKVIHYIWLSGEDMPEGIKMINEIWRELFCDYDFKLWDSSEYDKIQDKPRYVLDAYNQKKWAFVSDYIRAYALYTEGGWYFDSDLQMFRNVLDKYRDYEFVSSIENSGNYFDLSGYYWKSNIQAAFLGAQKECMILKDLLSYYKTADFYYKNLETLCLPDVLGDIAVRYGFNRKTKKSEQKLDNNGILLDYKQILQCNIWEQHLNSNDKPIGIHHCAHGWADNPFGIDVEQVKYFRKYEK